MLSPIFWILRVLALIWYMIHVVHFPCSVMKKSWPFCLHYSNSRAEDRQIYKKPRVAVRTSDFTQNAVASAPWHNHYGIGTQSLRHCSTRKFNGTHCFYILLLCKKKLIVFMKYSIFSLAKQHLQNTFWVNNFDFAAFSFFCARLQQNIPSSPAASAGPWCTSYAGTFCIANS